MNTISSPGRGESQLERQGQKGVQKSIRIYQGDLISLILSLLVKGIFISIDLGST